MKTKKSKKALSLMLAFLMAVSSLTVGFVAFGADSADALTNLDNAISAYETAMVNNTKASGLANAYKAYYQALQYRDAAKYGSQDLSKAQTFADNLNSAVTAMAASSPKFPSQTSTVDIGTNDVSNTVTNGMSGVVYYQGMNRAARMGTVYVEQGNSDTQEEVYAGNYVFLYDGSTPNTIPVMIIHGNNVSKKFSTTKYNRGLKGIYLGTANTNLSLVNSTWNTDNSAPNVFSLSGGNTTAVSAVRGTFNGFSQWKNNTVTWYGLSNVLKYTGTPTTYLTTIDTRFDFYNHDSKYTGGIAASGYITDGLETGSITTGKSSSTGNGYGYVLNLKAMQDAIDAGIEATRNYKDKTYASALALMEAVDAAAGADYSATDFATNTQTACSTVAGDMQSKASAVTTAVAGLTDNVTTTADSGYGQLREQINATKEIYGDGTNKVGWDETSWTKFTAAYTAAVTAMDNLNPDGNADKYTADAATLATNLKNNRPFKANMADDHVYAEEYADAVNRTQSYYTTSTWAALQTAIDETYPAVYPNGIANGTEITEANQSVMDGYAQTLATAIAGLRLDTTRLEELIVTAKAIDQTQILDANALVKAISQADQFVKDAENGIISGKNGEILYDEALQKLQAAIDYANTPYTMYTNGTVEDTYVRSNTAQEVSWNNGFNKSSVIAPSGKVVIKTQGAVLNNISIGETAFSMWSKAYNFDQSLFTTGINGISQKSVTVDSITYSLNWTGTSCNYDTVTFAGSVPSGSTIDPSDLNAILFSGTVCDAYGNAGNYPRVMLGHDSTNYATGTLTGDVLVNIPAASIAAGGAGYKDYTLSATFYAHEASKRREGAITYGEVNNDTFTYTPSFTLVDISTLCTLQNNAQKLIDNELNTDGLYYTIESMARLQEAMTGSKLITNSGAFNGYESAAAYVAAAKEAYSNLQAAISGMERQTYTITFISHDGTTTKSDYKTGDTVVVPTVTQTYEEVSSVDGKKYLYTFQGWDKEVVTIVNDNATYTAVYTSELCVADFSLLDAAVQTLLNSLSDNTYSSESLTALDAQLKALTYYNMDAQARAQVLSDVQDQVDAETDAVKAMSATTTTIDNSAGTEALAVANAVDPDAVVGKTEAIAAINAATGKVEVTVLTKKVVGLDQATYDSAIATALAYLTPAKYTVNAPADAVITDTSTGETIENGSLVEYGTNITVETADGSQVAWYMTYTSNVNNITYADKYLSTNNGVEMVVRGNTSFTTSVPSETTFKVTFVNGTTGKPYQYMYVEDSGEIELPAPPSTAHFTFSEYHDDAFDSDWYVTDMYQVIQDTVITANFTADDVTGYTISIQDELYDVSISSYHDLDGSTNETADGYTLVGVQYNDVVRISDINGYGIVGWLQYNSVTTEYTVLSTSSSCAFRACEDVVLYPCTNESELEMAINYDPVAKVGVSVVNQMHAVGDAPNGGLFIGQIVFPEETVKLVEYGILVGRNATEELTLENSASSSIGRCKATNRTIGNQFMITLTGGLSGYTITYCAYVVYEVDGTRYTLYSNTCTVA